MEATYVPQIYNEYKTRNILNLAERVEVIREYDRHLTRPSLQSLAQRFECSSKQIKNILINRDVILESFGNGNGEPKKQLSNNTGDLMQKRQEKIAFLGKVMYEYIQRMIYFNQIIDDQKFQLKALQVKECIAVENFQPTNAWLDDFKAFYSIPAINLYSLRNNVVITEPKRPHLSAIDMIQYVSRLEQLEGQESNRANALEHIPRADINAYANLKTKKNRSQLEGKKIVYEFEEGDGKDDEELLKLNFDDTTPKTSSYHNSLTSSTVQKPADKRRDSSFPDIESVDEALKHIKALEVYAMLNDNFRAIGLLTQLENIFQKKDRSQ